MNAICSALRETHAAAPHGFAAISTWEMQRAAVEELHRLAQGLPDEALQYMLPLANCLFALIARSQGRTARHPPTLVRHLMMGSTAALHHWLDAVDPARVVGMAPPDGACANAHNGGAR